MTHASESQHWYTLDGKPAYEVVGANGKTRPATLRDARKLNLVPSVTTIIKCAAAPGLERWKQEQVLHAALTMPKIDGESEADYLSRIMRDSQEQAKQAAVRGTAIHASLQGHFEGKPPSEEHWPHVQGAVEKIKAWRSEPFFEPWIAEQSFSHGLGFGGKCDLNGGNCVLDFKTKEFTADSLPKTWDEHAMQLAAYRVGLGRPKASCAIVFVSVSVPGLAHLVEIDEAELQKGWGCFQGLLTFWQHKNGYRPNFEKEAA